MIEKFTARVDANNDPEFRARIRVICPDFTGDPEAVLPDWIEPLLDWGWFLIPDVDELVEIEVVTGTTEDEVPGQSAILDPMIRWRGKRYYHTGEEAPTPVHDDFTSANYGKRRGFATPAGHILLFDDTEGAEKIRLSLKLGDECAYLEFDKSGNVTLSNVGDGLVLLGKGSPDAWLVRGDDWKAWEEAHTHPTGTGPSGPPAQPIPATVLSETTKVK